MKKKIYGGLFVISILALASFYAVNRPIENLSIKDARSEAQKLNLGIVNYPSFGLFYLAQEKGFFKEENLDVNIEMISDLNTMIPSLGSKRLDLMICSADFAAIIEDSGVEASQVLITDASKGADGMLVANDIDSWDDLRGKSVSLPLGFPSHFLFRYLAEENGIKPGEIKIVDTMPDQVGAGFLAGKIDYGMTWEPWLSKARERKDGKVLFTTKEVPEIGLNTITVRQEVLASKGQAVKSFMRAYFKAVDYWRQNPEEAKQIVAEKLGLPADDLVAMMSNIKLYDYAANKEKFDDSSQYGLKNISLSAIRIFKEEGIIKNKIDVSALYDSSLLETLYE